MTNEGAVRDRLVAAGVDLVLSEGQAAVSLREIARRAGVSHGAPRRYFPTHVDLLSAIAREGFADLTSRVEQTMRDAGPDPRTRLAALARTYLDFAAAHRGMFELMFRHDLLDSGRLRLRETSLPLFAVLADLVAQVRRPTDAPAPVLAGVLWANLHGIAQLWAWGSLPLATGALDDEALLRAALDAHLGPTLD
ncbi:TetR/AcrR family transcriptional regulator [Micromonospora parathelypteridis]|uniref:AcrR family transcriptional regulator n=1 Tax=Micromonospora parathelypteridis TaxID=1839617 RepID=A0A840VJ27_9ACTN|nr:TetR/AcrR family transcriptional regulator [Micromonospora parathelypteridis]MBB5476665.1 AcrR family transcriptional regulator [Micromonospora parathelypteridis]GGO16392.1 TetR family transcriptional regulator [Micromonospora parathelypteridis]